MAQPLVSSQPLIDRISLLCPRLPQSFDGLRILHLSDLHLTNWSPRMERWRLMLGGLRVDAVMITGDLGHRSWLWRRGLPGLRRLLGELRAPLGVFFILGNHDALETGRALQGNGIRGLSNEAVLVRHGTDRLAIIGLAQRRRIDADIPAALAHVRPTDFKLMLLHYPDMVYAALAAGADVCLAGHTHGGQICLPDGRPLMGHDSLPADFCTGVHRIKSTWLVVNRGMGKAGVRLRLFCPAQAIVLTLRRGIPPS